MMTMMMISHALIRAKGCNPGGNLIFVCCQNEVVEPVDDKLEGKEYFIERMKQRSKDTLMQRAIAAKIW